VSSLGELSSDPRAYMHTLTYQPRAHANELELACRRLLHQCPAGGGGGEEYVFTNLITEHNLRRECCIQAKKVRQAGPLGGSGFEWMEQPRTALLGCARRRRRQQCHVLLSQRLHPLGRLRHGRFRRLRLGHALKHRQKEATGVHVMRQHTHAVMELTDGVRAHGRREHRRR
jgi:hypothetical protein